MEEILVWSDWTPAPVIGPPPADLAAGDETVRRQMAEAWTAVADEAGPLLAPRALARFVTVPPEAACPALPAGAEAAYVLVTVGGGISRLTDEYFDQGDYLRGFLANRMGDDALVALDAMATRRLREACAARRRGAAARLTPGGALPMTFQRTIFAALEAGPRLGLRLTEGLMIDPVKSAAWALRLTEDDAAYRAFRSCRDCGKTDCPQRARGLAGDGGCYHREQ